MWDALVSKIPQRAVGIVLSVPPGVVRSTQQGHQGKEGKRTLVTDASFQVPRVIVLHTILCFLYRIISPFKMR